MGRLELISEYTLGPEPNLSNNPVRRYAEEVGPMGDDSPLYYEKPTPEGVYQHFKAVAEAIKIGIVVYNNPWTSKFTIGPELMEGLAEIPNIVAVKETRGDMTMALRLLDRTGYRLTYSMGGGRS